MPVCLICNDGYNYDKLSQHIKVKHHMTKDEYLIKFPDAILVSDSYSKERSEIAKRLHSSGRMNTEAREEQITNFRNKGIMYKLSEEGREESSKTARRTWGNYSESDKSKVVKRLNDSKEEWEKENPKEYSDKQYKSSVIRWSNPEQHKLASERLKKRWDTDEDYRKAMSIRSMNTLKNSRNTMTSIHVKVSDYLTSIGIYHLNEEIVNGISVDIYIPSLDKIIECNGEFWHGNPDILEISDMSRFQLDGYNRDLRRKNAFGNKVLFLWESEINDNTFIDKLSKFLCL